MSAPRYSRQPWSSSGSTTPMPGQTRSATARLGGLVQRDGGLELRRREQLRFVDGDVREFFAETR
ncbi:hypothetical protein [Streptomyces acidicola]|uniref:hypothetical protein n=1 Tax=Streptomyces acidicola TaxID=2596892 RepID=UPI003415BBC1